MLYQRLSAPAKAAWLPSVAEFGEPALAPSRTSGGAQRGGGCAAASTPPRKSRRLGAGGAGPAGVKKMMLWKSSQSRAGSRCAAAAPGCGPGVCGLDSQHEPAPDISAETRDFRCSRESRRGPPRGPSPPGRLRDPARSRNMSGPPRLCPPRRLSDAAGAAPPPDRPQFRTGSVGAAPLSRMRECAHIPLPPPARAWMRDRSMH